jgi:hypothetical protein
VSRPDDIARALRNIAPHIPRKDMKDVVDQALHSRGLKTANPEAAAWLSLVSYVRHTYTNYDELRNDNYERDAARFFVLADINKILTEWGVKRVVSATE